jgi:ABC-type sugar transport system, periplasmic component
MRRTVIALAACALLFGAFAASAQSRSVSIWSWQYAMAEPQGTDGTKLVQAFMKENPGIKAERAWNQYDDYITKLKLALMSGTGPDVMGMQVGATLKEFSQFIEPIDSYAERDFGKDWRKKLVASSMSQLDLGGPVLALPVCLSLAGTMWVDQTILDKYGLKAPTNYAELKSVAAALRAKGELPFVIGAKDSWIDLDVFLSFAGDTAGAKLRQAIDGKASWTDPAMVKAFAAWQNLFSDKIVEDGALGLNMYMDAYNLWSRDGKAPLQPNGSWEMGSFNPASGDNFANFMKHRRDVVRMIDVSGDGAPSPALATPDVVFAINKASKDKEAAWQLIKFAVFGAGQQLMTDNLAFFPVAVGMKPTVQMSDDQKRIYAKFQDFSGTALGFREIPYPDLKQALIDQLQLLAVGKVKPEAAAQAVEKVSKSLAR